MSLYQLSEAAEADLRAVIRYTREQWSVQQVRRYVGKLESGMASIAAGEGHFQRLENVAPGLTMARCEHHYLFCLTRAADTPLIVAILHERMDLVARAGDRMADLGRL